MDIVTDTSPAAMLSAIEANSAEFLLEMGRAGGAEERYDEFVHWTIGGSPIDYNNAVVRATIPPERADAVIQASRKAMRAHGVPGTWHVSPSMRPLDLPERLAANRFVYSGNDTAMAADLDQIPPLEVSDDITIRRVVTDDDMGIWIDTLGRGFGEGPHEAKWVGEMFKQMGYARPSLWRHYIGYLEDAPVATSTLFLGAGVAGIYFVFTVESARRRGMGAALTLAPLHEAHAVGYRIGVLGSSDLGKPVYKRIGFKTYGNISIFEWRP